MKTIGIRDVIGPIMTGPSSSHTAGALRIASMCRLLLSGEPVHARFTLYGSFAHTFRGHGTDKALVAGLLGLAADDVRVKESFELARERGFSFEFVPDAITHTAHPNTVDIEVSDTSGTTCTMRGESIGGGAAVVVGIDGVDVQVTGEYHSIVVKQHDVKGVLAHITSCLNAFDVNIATARLFREGKGEIAYTVMQTDDKIDEALVRAIEALPSIYSVRVIASERCAGALPPVAASEAQGVEGFGAGLSPEEAGALFDALNFSSAVDMLAYCEQEEVSLGTAMCRRERAMLGAERIAVDDTRHYLGEVLEVMREAALTPLSEVTKSMGGLIGGEAALLNALGNKGVLDGILARACVYSMAVLETNASMGRIVAAPTAGSSGVLPGALLAAEEIHDFTNSQLVDALANAAAIGYLITRNATVSGAEGGCQAEVGSASAMAASALCQLFGGSPRQCLAAASNAIAGLMGLVCDPIAGLVEAPCQKRNATGVANALVSAQIALCGVENLVNFDQTVDAMFKVGRALPFELRESALGGLAATPSACNYCTGCSHK